MRHLYKVDDGERHIISAETEDQAREMYATEYGADMLAEVKAITQFDDNKQYTIKYDDAPEGEELQTMTCGEWAQAMTGVIASSIY